MGVHYFYSWLCKRYPLIRKEYDQQVIPSIDNFFVDLNGLIYTAARDSFSLYRDLLRPKRLVEIFSAVVDNLNSLINRVRPRKRLFIAVDGVAPKAKMNQQRQRRYKSTREAQDTALFMEELVGIKPPTAELANNSICPGSDFMLELIETLTAFILQKIREDPAWKKIEVVLSGGDVAGEGEHKCMDWIRGWKQSKEFDINETHCIYGNDADLIFLSLALHLPKLIILREIPVYSNDNPIKSASKRNIVPVQYEIVFISLVREYMEIEFMSIQEKLSFPVNIEKIVDDFILIAFFIGNDFLHQLYCMNAKEGNFDEIISIYKSTLAQLPGYINDKGEVHWGRFLLLLQKITKLELTMIGTTLDGINYQMRDIQKKAFVKMLPNEEKDYAKTGGYDSLAFKRKKNKKPKKPKSSEEPDPFEDPVLDPVDIGEMQEKPPVVEQLAAEPVEEALEKSQEHVQPPVPKFSFEREAIKKYFKMKDLVQFIGSVHATFKKGEQGEIEAKKKEFYRRYFAMQDMERLDDVCLEYLKGIDFVINYYFKGCPSWTWAFKYNMSPFLSDLCQCLERHVASINHRFEMDEPLLPFHQMAYLLPKDSLDLLPAPLAHELRTNPTVSRFYPEVLDMFEPFDAIKEYQWIARLEEFDEHALQAVVYGVNQSLYSEKERKRNTPGHNMVFRYQAKKPLVSVKSKLRGFDDFEERIEISHLEIAKSYPYDHTKSNYLMTGLDNTNWPSLYQLEGIQGKLERIDRKSPVVRLELSFAPQAVLGKKLHQGKVFYDYPFRRVGDINSSITKEGVQLHKGGLPGELQEELEKAKGLEGGPYAKFMKESVKRLYKRKVIDYQEGDAEEPLYVVQGRQAGYRTCSDNYGRIVFDHQAHEILPHRLLLQVNGDGSDQSQLVFPSYEEEMFKPGYRCVSLETGDLCQVLEDFDETHLTVTVLSANSMEKPIEAEWLGLVDKAWIKVDEGFLAEMGVQAEEVLALYAIMDSFVVNVEQTKTSAMVLGEGFDIGLQMMRAINTLEADLQVVANLVRLVKREQKTNYSLLVRADKYSSELTPYDVYVSPKAKNIIKEYVSRFEDIFGYLKGDVCFYIDRYALPAQHDIWRVFKSVAFDDDPNPRLFQAYNYVMSLEVADIPAGSALTIMCASDKLKHFSEAFHQPSIVEKNVKLDRNMAIPDSGRHFAIGTPFKRHPPWHRIGDRVVHVNTADLAIPFGETGTVIGVHFLNIIVLFDRPFIGGSTLFGEAPPFRGGIVSFQAAFNLSRWTDLVYRKEYLLSHCALIEEKMLKEQSLEGLELGEWDGQVAVDSLIEDIKRLDKMFL